MKKIVVALALLTFVITGCGKTAETVDYAYEASTDAVNETAEISLESTEETTNEALEEVVEEATKASTLEEKETAAEASTSSTLDENKAKVEDTSSTKATTEEKEAEKVEQSTTAGNEEKAEEQAKEQETTPQKIDYGRILYVGDSRSVDLFDQYAEEVRAANYNGITVYCKNACQLSYMEGAVGEVGMDGFDTLVSWMGCNDYGNFAKYEPFYNNILAQGKKLIVCTVGPTDDNCLDEEDRYYYDNARELEYNAALVNWANNNGVKVIDLYSYITSHDSVYVDPADGIHYQPQPTTELWSVILANLN